jgi:HTH-type transcriptional regulator/antitoxin HigA
VFWFTFFHEAGHLLRHSKKVTFADDRNDAKEQETQSFVDDGTIDERLEREADDFARRLLIPDEYEAELAGLTTAAEITDFANRIGVAPGNVLGRLQFDKKLLYSDFPRLKRRLAFDG